MGGEGAMAAANASLKYNRSLVGRKTFKDLKSYYKRAYSKKKPNFKKVSKEELVVIKKQIKEKAIAHRRKTNVKMAITFSILIIAIIIFTLIIYRNII